MSVSSKGEGGELTAVVRAPSSKQIEVITRATLNEVLRDLELLAAERAVRTKKSLKKKTR